jgi:hypothetical protein
MLLNLMLFLRHISKVILVSKSVLHFVYETRKMKTYIKGLIERTSTRQSDVDISLVPQVSIKDAFIDDALKQFHQKNLLEQCFSTF